jgi:integrase
MSEKPISPLRQRMLEDMRVRGFTPDTQRDYIRAVKKLASFLGRSPDTATAEDLRAFQLQLTATGVQPPTINTTVTVLRFFFEVTLDRPETTRHLVFVYGPRKLPRVLSPEEVQRLLEAAPGPKHKAALSIAYGAGSFPERFRTMAPVPVAPPRSAVVRNPSQKLTITHLPKPPQSIPEDRSFRSTVTAGCAPIGPVVRLICPGKTVIRGSA